MGVNDSAVRCPLAAPFGTWGKGDDVRLDSSRGGVLFLRHSIRLCFLATGFFLIGSGLSSGDDVRSDLMFTVDAASEVAGDGDGVPSDLTCTGDVSGPWVTSGRGLGTGIPSDLRIAWWPSVGRM